MTFPSVIAALAMDLPSMENVEKIIDGWKLSTEDAKRLRWSFEAKDRFAEAELEDLQAELVFGADREMMIALLERMDEQWNADRVREWNVPTFPVTGAHLIEAGVKPGPEMGRILHRMKDDWVLDGFSTQTDFYVANWESFRD